MAVECSQNLCLFTFRASVGFFNRLYRIHLHFQNLRQQKLHFLPYYPSRRENSPLNLIIPEEKFGHLSAISATSFPGSFFYFEKVPAAGHVCARILQIPEND